MRLRLNRPYRIRLTDTVVGATPSKVELTLTEGVNRFKFDLSRAEADKIVGPWVEDFDDAGILMGRNETANEDGSTMKIPVKNYLKRWRGQELEEKLEGLKDVNKRIFNKMIPTIHSETPPKHRRFLDEYFKKEKAPISGMESVSLRTKDDHYSGYVPQGSGFGGKTFSMTEMERHRSDSKKLIDLMLDVKDQKALDKNVQALRQLLAKSLSTRPGTVGDYLEKQLNGIRETKKSEQ